MSNDCIPGVHLCTYTFMFYYGLFKDSSPEAWRTDIKVNITAYLHVCSPNQKSHVLLILACIQRRLEVRLRHVHYHDAYKFGMIGILITSKP